MSLSIFGEKAIQPNEEQLEGALVACKPLWDGLKNHITSTYGNTSEEWKYYSKSAGWTLVIKSKKQTLLYLVPLSHSFKVNFVFGEKAVAAAQKANLPEPVCSLILEAKQYMEGRSFMVDVTTEADINTVIKLLEIKNQI